MALLLAAVSHAGWNALVKKGSDKLHSMVVIAFGTSVIAAVFLPFVNTPSPVVYGWIALSLFIHFFYKLCLMQAYKFGDFAQIYPIARGSIPLLVLIAAFIFIGERVGLPTVGFIIILATGVCLASFKGGASPAINKSAIGFALLTAFFSASYTLVDGVAVRLNQDAFSYVIWLLTLDGLILLGFAYWREGSKILLPLKTNWRIGIIGGVLSLTAYGITLWAMTQIPLALVSGLRETSILFAMLIAWLFVKERMNCYRIIAALLIVIGAIGIKLV